jgi:hypothetical protein
MLWWDKTLRPWATIRNVILLFLVCIALNLSLLTIARTFTGDRQLLDLQLLYSPADANRFLCEIGPSGRQRYLWMLLAIDLLFPAAYALFFSLLLLRVDRQQQRTFLLALPLAAAALDWCENFGIAALIFMLQSGRPSSIAWCTMVCTLAKWLALGLCIFAIPIGWRSDRIQRRP